MSGYPTAIAIVGLALLGIGGGGANVSFAAPLLLNADGPKAEQMFRTVQSREDFKVYFDYGRDQLTAAAQQIVDVAVMDFVQKKAKKLTIEAHVDASEYNEFGIKLAEARAANIRAHLTKKGLKTEQIVIQTNLTRPTAKAGEERNPRDRYVGLVFAK